MNLIPPSSVFVGVSGASGAPYALRVVRALGDAGYLGGLFKRYGVTRDAVLQVLKELRGSQRAEDPNAEEKYQALQRFGRDLTELARRGKLDPAAPSGR